MGTTVRAGPLLCVTMGVLGWAAPPSLQQRTRNRCCRCYTSPRAGRRHGPACPTISLLSAGRPSSCCSRCHPCLYPPSSTTANLHHNHH
jgi:hypothetical protein